MPYFLYIIWDIDPEIISSPISLRYYGLGWASAFIAGYYILQKIFKSDKVPEPWLDSILMYIMIGTIAGARLGDCLFYHWEYYQNNLLEIFLPIKLEPELHFTGFRGLASHGAGIGMLIAAYLWSKKISKKSMLWTMDRVALTVLIGAAFIRTGNLMNSEIIGLPSDLPWAFVFKQIDDVPRHPGQLYEALSYLIIFFLLYFLFTKKNWKKVEGSIFGLFMILMFIARFLLEFFKENQVGFEDSLSLNMGQILSIPFVIIGIVLLLKKKNKQKT